MNDGIQELGIIKIEKKLMIETVQTGEQTQITPKVKEISEEIKGEGVVIAMKIADYIRSMDIVTNSIGPDFTRTADEILKDNKYNGCNEAGVVFATLLRAKGIPTTYIQALNREAVQRYTEERPSLVGHVYLEVDFGENKDKNIKIIDSTSGEITDQLPENMIVGAKGLDAWDMNLKKGFDDLKIMFREKHQAMMI